MQDTFVESLLQLFNAFIGEGLEPIPGVDAYLRYCASFGVRYYAAAGGLFLVFQVLFAKHFARYRIQRQFPPAARVWHEIRWAFVNILANGITAMVLYQLLRRGYTSMYYGLLDRGLAYLVVSAVIVAVGYETWNYWLHRLMHTPWFFRHIHWVHHRSTNPTAFAAFAQHPLESLMGSSFVVLLIALVPLHPFALVGARFFLFPAAIFLHHGYEFCPAGFTRHRIFGWLNTPTHHNLHHTQVTCNFSIWFNAWDRIMNTNHPAYHQIFETVASQRSARPVG